MFAEIGAYKALPHAMLIPAGFAFTITPLHYLYTKFLVTRSKRLTRLDSLHFLPVVLYKLYLIPDFLKSGEVLYETTGKSEYEFLPMQFHIFNWMIVIQGIVYLSLSLFLIRRYSGQIKNIFSSIEKIKLGCCKP